MNRSTNVLSTLVLSVVFISACQQEAEQPTAPQTTAAPQATAAQPKMVDLAPALNAPASAPMAHGMANGITSGVVAETINAAGYTYARVEVEGQSLWAAGPTTAMAVGDTITFSTQIPMQNFHSTAMNRDFPVLYFVDGFNTGGTPAAAASAPAAPAPSVEVVAIDKVEGGYTIAEALAQKIELAGKPIKVRGKVTKFTGGIMGKNWIHIVDGSSAEDLIVTTSGTTAMGAVIVAEGALSLDRDFGYGYHYAVLMEDASVTAE